MNQTACFIRSKIFLACIFFAPIFFATRSVSPDFRYIKISEVKNYSTDEKRDIYSTFDAEDQKDQGMPIDPFTLMNRLKQVGAMNDATTPSEALDEALNAFDQSEYTNVPIK